MTAMGGCGGGGGFMGGGSLGGCESSHWEI
jgi:hypothetical protein